MPDPLTVEPNVTAPAAPDAAPAAPEAPAVKQTALPPELLKLPAMHALMAGSPPAVSAPIKEFSNRPQAELIVKNIGALQAAGFGLYRSLDGKLGVLFNQLYLHGDELKAADQAGQLSKLAPPFDVIDHVNSKSGHLNPVLSRKAVPGGLKNSPMPTTQQFSNSGGNIPAAPVGSAPLPASAQKRIAGTRAANMGPGVPTSGQTPGQGALLRSILKPIV